MLNPKKDFKCPPHGTRGLHLQPGTRKPEPSPDPDPSGPSSGLKYKPGFFLILAEIMISARIKSKSRSRKFFYMVTFVLNLMFIFLFMSLIRLYKQLHW